MGNKDLNKAKQMKNDEFYTQYQDIQKEVEAYLEYNPDTFKDKVVYCNCDDPYESNFFRFFVLNFRKLGLKKLITTSYNPSPIANTQLDLFGEKNTINSNQNSTKKPAVKLVIQEVGDIDENGEFNLKDIEKQLKENKHNEWSPLKGNGDFRSQECIELLKQSDIVVTNPPFSLFREYVKQLFDYNKKFLIIGSLNAITYKEIFPLIKQNKIWLGHSITSGDREFQVPDYYPLTAAGFRIDEQGRKFVRVKGVRWFTNLDHGRRHQVIPPMTMADNLKFNKKIQKNPDSYKKYDNYNAIEVPYTEAIPSDYSGVMGVPISFLDRYNPVQFEIIGMAEDNGRGFSGGIWDGTNPHCVVNGRNKFKRIFIKHRRK